MAAAMAAKLDADAMLHHREMRRFPLRVLFGSVIGLLFATKSGALLACCCEAAGRHSLATHRFHGRGDTKKVRRGGG